MRHACAFTGVDTRCAISRDAGDIGIGGGVVIGRARRDIDRYIRRDGAQRLDLISERLILGPELDDLGVRRRARRIDHAAADRAGTSDALVRGLALLDDHFLELVEPLDAVVHAMFERLVVTQQVLLNTPYPCAEPADDVLNRLDGEDHVLIEARYVLRNELHGRQFAVDDGVVARPFGPA